MVRKRKKDDYPEEWDVVDETQDPDAIPPLFEIVAETQDSDAEVDVVTNALSQLPPPSQKSLAPPTYRIKETTKEINSSVICKLTRICKFPLLVGEIKKVCIAMKQVQLEGWHLANLHVLRCLKEGDEVPKIEQMFFYRCCTATLGNIEKRDRGSTESKYPAFHKTCLRYWAGRERESTYEPEFIQTAGDMVNEMAKLMEINALNMIALHFRQRLHQYIQFRYAKKGDTKLKYRETRRLVDSCYRVKSEPEKGDEGNPTGKTAKVWTEWDDTDDPVEQELREWLGIAPWQWQIRANPAHFLHKLYDMLVWMEKFVDKHRKTKGARVYSLLPVATTFQAAYVKLNASTLHGLLARLIDLSEVEDFLKKELNIVPTRKRTGSQLPFDKKTFQKNRSEVIRKVFDVEQFETLDRKFADEIKTNGYGASITMIRPVTTVSVALVEKKASKKKRMKNDGTAELVSKEKAARKKKVKTPEEIAEEDTFAKELFKLGPDYSPNVLIGIDPGMRSLATAVSVGRLQRRRRRQKSRRGLHRRHRTRRARRKERVIEISTPKYRHLARMNDFRFYNENLKMREPWYAGVMRAMPSFKTSSYDLYFQRLQFFWKHLQFLLVFSAEQAFLRWRFTQDRAKMKALDTLAKRIVPKANKQVCIAYGDWSRRNGIKGHASGPVKGFVEALKRRATVIPMDEYRTSITCSCCHQRLKQARLFTKMKRKEDEVDILQKERPSKKEMKEIVEMAKFKNPKLADKKVVLKCTRNVLRCTNSKCKANFWNRDVNAARNMLELLKSGLKEKHGARRLRAFRRGQ
uniref:Uncharacterized protein n=1 Tax=Globisporangium ultimum (strain ATCC 200006 / CBS 805.95 / DAOM BR144) TaxID=431595 RepID=K3WWL0_GLOUD